MGSFENLLGGLKNRPFANLYGHAPRPCPDRPEAQSDDRDLSLSDRLFDDADTAPIDPFALFEEWFAEAQASEPNDPHAMAVATVDAAGLPDVRMVLMNARDHRGFVFFTNFDSRKGEELLAHPKAALVFHWKSLRRQVRARGPVEIVTDAEADAYFATRSRGSPDRRPAPAGSRARSTASATLMAAVERLEAELGDRSRAAPAALVRLPHRPAEIEFWKDGEFRLHDRVRFTRADSIAPWTRQRLYP